MELTEKADLRAINYLSTLSLTQFKTYVKWSCNEEQMKILYNNFKTFCKLNIKSKGEVKRLYSYTLITPNDVGGRLFSGGSIQGLPADIRGVIIRNYTTDIDMKNAHPTILKYLCKKHNIQAPNLHYFCDNREDIFKTINDNKDYCKKLFLKAVNSDKVERKEKNQFFKAFDKECKNIQQILCNLPEYKHIVDCVPAGKLFNWYGSAINRILCSYENKILQEVISVINRNNIEISVLMFDGLMIYGNHYENEDLLIQVEGHINQVFDGLNMKMSYKQHSNEIIIPDDYTIPTIIQKTEDIKEKINSFEKVKEEFEKTHFKIINSSTFMKIYDNRIIAMNKTQIKTSYEHLQYEEIKYKNDELTIIKKQFIDEWLKCPDIKCYDDVGVYPHPLICPKDVFNLWRTFSMELIEDYEEKNEELKIILNHIKILCNNDEVVYNYFIKWIAQMIQFPAIKTICPTLISEEGAGKGTLIRLIEKMLGQQKVLETTKPSRDVWGNFNVCMVNSFFVVLNELERKETLEAEGIIKGLITDDTLTINVKGVSQYIIQSYHRFIITTNKEEPIKTKKGDRRKIIIKSSDELCENKEYFKQLYNYLDDVNVIKTCFEYFKSIEGVNDFSSITMPITEYQEDLQELSICPIQSWIKDFATSNAGNGEDIIEFTSKEAFTQFNTWKNENKINYDLNNIQFGVRLKRLNIKGITGKHTKFGEKKVFNIPELVSQFCPTDM